MVSSFFTKIWTYFDTFRFCFKPSTRVVAKFGIFICDECTPAYEECRNERAARHARLCFEKYGDKVPDSDFFILYFKVVDGEMCSLC